MLTTYLLILTLQNSAGNAVTTHEMKTLTRCETAGEIWTAQQSYRYYTCSKI